MKKVFSICLIFLLVFVLSSCNSLKEGQYFSNEKNYISIENNMFIMYQDNVEKYKAQFTYNDNILSLTIDSEAKEYLYNDNMLILNSPLENGVIPDGEKFNAFCSDEDGVYRLTFRDDGTFVKSVDYSVLYDFISAKNSFAGYYTRKGNLITISYEGGSINYMYTQDGKLYDSVYILES